jgi:anti-sigma B factor antagonist
VANPFSIHKSTEQGISILALEGYLDAHTAPAFEKAVQTEFEAGRVRLLVECSRLTYISSAGLGVFMSFIEEIRAAAGDIKICGLAPTVFQVFDILGFSALFDIVPDRTAAIQKYQEAPVRET